jgi:23S rRNA pseudouridine2605 synthase
MFGIIEFKKIARQTGTKKTIPPPGKHTNLSTMHRINEPRKVGLARALSKLGYCSRSNAAKMIYAGEVSLNGTIRRDPEFPVNLDRDRIEASGNAIKTQARIYWMLNKPRGLVTTASDEQGRETIYSLLDDTLPWMGPVGRLDKATEGLLLLTNDSEWAARISDPSSHLDKIYHVQIRATGTHLPIENLERGVVVSGEVLRAKAARIIRAGDKNTWIEIVLDEGKNRQIRRMFEYFGIEVVRLIRIGIGPIQLGQLARGKSRTLMLGEKNAIDRALAGFHTG